MAYQQHKSGNQPQSKGNAKRSYRKYTNHTKPTSVNASNIFNRSKAKPKIKTKKTFRIQAMPNMTKSKTVNTVNTRVADVQKRNGLAQLEHNWKTRKPYAHSRKSTKRLRKTEFILLLNEQQMTQCYDPVRLYEINKQLMVKTIGTCRVEGLKLIISVPNGRKDLTEGIQIIEKIIGPVQYLDDAKQELYAVSRQNAVNHFNTMHLTLSPAALQPVDSHNANDLLIYTSLPVRQRGTSMLSNQIGNDEPNDSSRIKVSEQFVIQKRKPMRRYSENYVDCLKKNQIKSVLQTIQIVEEDDGDNDDNDYGYNSNEDDYKTAENGQTTEPNTEQEWDDFDEIMTESSVGIRLQAQKLMERKLKLRAQQKEIEQRIRQRQQSETEEYKSQEDTVGHESTSTMNTMIIHPPMSINTRFNTEDIPDLPRFDTMATSSTMDELYTYGSYRENATQNIKHRSGSRESEVLRSLQTLSQDIDEELRSIDDKILCTNNNEKQVFSASSVSYNNEMLRMLKNETKNKRNSSLHNSILPFHRSQPQNEALLHIIHTIQNMPRPVGTDYNNEYSDRSLISLVTREFPSAFRELSYGVIMTTELDSNDDEDRRDSAETVPAPQSLDSLPPLIDEDNNSSCIQSIPKKRNIKYVLNDTHVNSMSLEDEYRDIEYIKSALFDDEDDDGVGSKSNESDHVMHSLLAQSNLLSEIIFYNIASIMKHFAFLLQIVDSLSFGLQHQRERILATMLKKVSAMKQSDYLQQKLLFLYWSYDGKDSVMSHNDSDFYLYNEYHDLILYGLSSIIYAANADEDQKSSFIVESSKCWKRIISHLVCNQSEVVLDGLEDLSPFNIPSKVLFPSINMRHMRYHKSVNQLAIQYFVYQRIYQYKNCNVYDILCSGYHSNNKIKLKSPFLLRIGIDCIPSQQMQYVYELMNCMWSSYKYIIPKHPNKVTIHNKILFLQCQSIAKNVGVWCLRAHLIHMHSVPASKWDVIVQNVNTTYDIQRFAHHFIVSSATIFIASYIMGLEWSEVLQTCFICLEYGDVYQLSPVSILCCDASASHKQKALNQMLHERDNVFLEYIYKWLQLISNNNDLWHQWVSHVQRLFNIIVFNINESSLNKDKKHYFDHSHLFQIVQVTKMLYAKQIKMHRIIKHFSNLLNAQL